MTLDFKKLVRNSVLKQQKIQHFECNVQIFKQEELPPAVVQKIQKAYGNDFLADANYTLWFSGQNITKEIIEKTLFKIANKALGEAANSMAESDFKTIDLAAVTDTEETPEKTLDDVDSVFDSDSETANADAIHDLVGDDDNDDADEADDLDESVESPEAGEKFVFLKITMK